MHRNTVSPIAADIVREAAAGFALGAPRRIADVIPLVDPRIARDDHASCGYCSDFDEFGNLPCDSAFVRDESDAYEGWAIFSEADREWLAAEGITHRIARPSDRRLGAGA